MSLDLAAVRADLADALADIAGFEVYLALLANHDPPCLMVGVPIEVDYHESLNGASGVLQRVDLPVKVVVNGADPVEAVAALDAALSFGIPGSVPDVVESASGSWRAVQVLGATNVAQVAQGDTEIATADLIVRFYT